MTEPSLLEIAAEICTPAPFDLPCPKISWISCKVSCMSFMRCPFGYHFISLEIASSLHKHYSIIKFYPFEISSAWTPWSHISWNSWIKFCKSISRDRLGFSGLGTSSVRTINSCFMHKYGDQLWVVTMTGHYEYLLQCFQNVLKAFKQ